MLHDVLIIGIVVAGYIVLTRVVLPKLGVST